MSNYAIIVAGGKGLRMGGDVPKQFLPVGGKPILMRTIERFREYDEKLNIIMVLPVQQQEYWNNLCLEHSFRAEIRIANGGETRFESSKNGLDAIPSGESGLVAIHDGVRPFVSIETISRCFNAASAHGAAIPVLPVVESLRVVEPNGESKNVLRSNYRMVQTPQVFQIGLAKQAFAQEYNEAFTDDASVIESFGHSVAMVDGNRENIKLTTPYDLSVAQTII